MKSLTRIGVVVVVAALAVTGSGCGTEAKSTDRPVGKSGTTNENPQTKADEETKKNNKNLSKAAP